MILVKLFKLGVAFLVIAAALTTTTMAQELEEVPTDSTQNEATEKNRTDRLNEYKQRANERASEAKLNSIRNRCSAAQTRLENVANADRSKIDTRIAAHQRVINAVSRVSSSLQEAGIDTAELQNVQEELVTNSEGVITGLQAYLTTLNDIIAIDCENDAEAFQAGLIVARQARKDLKDLASSFREYVKTEVKSTLQQIKDELNADSEEV